MGVISSSETGLVPRVAECKADAECGTDSDDELREGLIQVAEIQVVSGGEVLTGRVHTIPLILTYPSCGNTVLLQQNLKLAKIIIDYVHERIIFSSNYPNRRTPSCFASISRIRDLANQLDYVRNGKTREEKVSRSIECGVGNCGEMTLVGLQCPDIGETPIERCKIAKPADHSFLVIGRDPNTDPKDPSKWNPETVICDPWADAFYPADRINDFLISYLGLFHVKSKKVVTSCSPKIIRFNPALHYIKLCRS